MVDVLEIARRIEDRAASRRVVGDRSRDEIVASVTQLKFDPLTPVTCSLNVAVMFAETATPEAFDAGDIAVIVGGVVSGRHEDEIDPVIRTWNVEPG